MILSKFAKREM